MFTMLDGKPLTAEELAQHLKADARAVARILDCLVVFELLREIERALRADRKRRFLFLASP